MAINLGELFGKGSIAEQFLVWQVLGQFAQPMLAPMIQTLASEVWQLDPNLPVPPDALASLVSRGLLPMGDGINESSKSGMGEPQFRKLVTQSANGPTLIEAIELLRRDAIPEGTPGEAGVTFYGAIKEAGIRDDWAELLAQLRVNKPSGQAALQALLQGQIERDLAYKLWVQAGEDPDWFQHAFDSEGTAPTPDMLGTMANRDIVGWDGTGPAATTFEQGFLEGPWRNKWLKPMRELMAYLPPARTITAMVHAGSITDARALELWRKLGLSAELAQAYLADAHHTKAAATKELTQSQISQLYRDGKITEAQAEELITKLGYSAANAALILSLANVQRADTHVTAAINRVRAQYTAHHITQQSAKKALTDLHVAPDQATELMDLWDLEIGINVKLLTPAQIIAAWDQQIITEADCATELEHLGYSAFAAWLLMSTKHGAPLPNKPARDTEPGVNP